MALRKLSVVGLCAVLVGALLVGVTSTPAPAAVDDPPNIVVIMTDDQTLEQMRVLPLTRSLIGDAGTTYENFVVALPLCCPSRATYFTGQYAFNHGVVRNEGVDGGFDNFDNATAMPVWLQNAGYKTIHVGKHLNGYDENSLPATEGVPAGWDDWQGMARLGYFDYEINDNGDLMPYGSAEEDYSTDVLADRAVGAITESAPGEPYFLNLGVFAPHATKVEGGSPIAIPAPRDNTAFATEPLPKPMSYNEADVSDKPSHVSTLPLISGSPTAGLEGKITSRYREELESLLAVDDAVQDVMDAVEASGESDNTVVIFTSDNGFHHGEHRIVSSKGQPYEESIHVPLMIRGPGFTPGAKVTSLTANIDLAPTIAAIAGATPLLPVDGTDLRSAPVPNRSVVLEGYDGACFNGLRTATETYVRYTNGEEEYYNLATDPLQLVNQPGAARVATLSAELEAKLPATLPACQGGTTSVLLTVTKAGSGAGEVRSDPAGLNCGTTCTKTFATGTVVTLIATPAAGSTFAGWSGGGCSGTDNCVVTMSAAQTVTATFNTTGTTTQTLTVAKSGAGSGTVTSSPAGINCGNDCSEPYVSGTVVTLTAAPATGSTFAGWSGACTNLTGVCTVTMSAARSVTATFNASTSTFLLTVSKTGTGKGTVTSSPTGINCGADCTQAYSSGTVVTLTAKPSRGNTFGGWTGACTNTTGTCTVTMTAAKSVTAKFNRR